MPAVPINHKNIFPSRQNLLLGYFFFLALCSCQPDSTINKNEGQDSLNTHKEKRGPGGCLLLSGRNTVIIDSIEVEIWVPFGPVRGDLLVLPGWDFPRSHWCDSTKLCASALEKGYRLIMPEMGKSVYSSKFFPETKTSWTFYPSGTWTVDTLIPTLRKEYCLLNQDSANFILGLSTGARGVALICERTGTLFRVAAGLSGDYDQTLVKGDNLIKGFYGDYEKFPERWEGEDNPVKRVKDMNVPIYLGHGKADMWVPFEQTKVFFDAISKAHPTLPIELHLVDFIGHSFSYWDSEILSILNFFEKHRNRIHS